MAQKAKPNWKAVATAPVEDNPYSSMRLEKPDATMPELDVLYRKYFGADRMAAHSARKAAQPKQAKRSKMVVMEPKKAADRSLGRKTVRVENGQVVGEQG